MVACSKSNNLNLNANKRKAINFGNSSSIIPFDYIVDNNIIGEVNSRNDLGAVVESSFEFKNQLELTVSKSFNVPVFIMRSTQEFSNTDSIIYLYKTLVL